LEIDQDKFLVFVNVNCAKPRITLFRSKT